MQCAANTLSSTSCRTLAKHWFIRTNCLVTPASAQVSPLVRLQQHPGWDLLWDAEAIPWQHQRCSMGHAPSPTVNQGALTLRPMFEHAPTTHQPHCGATPTQNDIGCPTGEVQTAGRSRAFACLRYSCNQPTQQPRTRTATSAHTGPIETFQQPHEQHHPRNASTTATPSTPDCPNLQPSPAAIHAPLPPLLLPAGSGFICSSAVPLPLLLLCFFPCSAAVTFPTQSSWLRAQLMKAASMMVKTFITSS